MLNRNNSSSNRNLKKTVYPCIWKTSLEQPKPKTHTKLLKLPGSYKYTATLSKDTGKDIGGSCYARVVNDCNIPPVRQFSKDFVLLLLLTTSVWF